MKVDEEKLVNCAPFTNFPAPKFFCVQYVALLILWLHVYLNKGKEACIPCVGDVLVVLSDLLEHEDQEVC